MPRRVSWMPTGMALLALLLSAPCFAAPVVVPDDYPTIQAALDAGADSIWVRDGLAPEDLIITPDGKPWFTVTIEPWNGIPPYYGTPWTPCPMIRTLRMAEPCQTSTLALKGLRFLAPVELGMCGGSLLIEECRFDSGFVGPNNYFPGPVSSVRHCLFIGNVTIASPHTQFLGNTVIGGKAWIRSDGSHDIRDNYIAGPADVGLELGLGDSFGPVSHNTIRSTTIGIRASATYRLTANDVEGCSGDGIVVDYPYSQVVCDSNRVVNCGGIGIASRPTGPPWGSMRLVGNIIRGTGGSGIALWDTWGDLVSGNTILDAGDDGFYAEHVSDFSYNVVGRSAGVGVRIADGSASASHNTIFSNAQDGMLIASGNFWLFRVSCG